MRAILLALAALSLAACASAAPTYAPALSPGAPGYSELRIERDRYRVTYRAAAPADARLVQDFALFRAAQLTLENGYDWFVIDDRSLDERLDAGGPRASIGVGGGSYGRRSGVGVGVGIGFPLGRPREPEATAASLNIRLGRGPRPADANAYDAREVARALNPASTSR